MVSVSSAGVEWGGSAAFEERMAHEAVWERRLRANAATGVASSLDDMEAYLLLGGHRGYFDFTHGRYKVSPGADWGGSGGSKGNAHPDR